MKTGERVSIQPLPEFRDCRDVLEEGPGLVLPFHGAVEVVGRLEVGLLVPWRTGIVAELDLVDDSLLR